MQSIVQKCQEYALKTFLPGERASINWITYILYQYQHTEDDPMSEIEQDIVWAAERIESDRSKWNLSKEEYLSARYSQEIDPRGLNARIDKACDRLETQVAIE
jgi:hypothetical protein